MSSMATMQLPFPLLIRPPALGPLFQEESDDYGAEELKSCSLSPLLISFMLTIVMLTHGHRSLI